ncbi:MAG: hypothetical protein U0223_19865 [Nitrospira sp.]|nr:hypothetical protein [Nitrospira sp.]
MPIDPVPALVVEYPTIRESVICWFSPNDPDLTNSTLPGLLIEQPTFSVSTFSPELD